MRGLQIFWVATVATITGFIIWAVATVYALVQMDMDMPKWNTFESPAASTAPPIRYTPDGKIVTDIGGGYERDMETGDIRPFGSIWE